MLYLWGKALRLSGCSPERIMPRDRLGDQNATNIKHHLAVTAA